MPNLALTFFGSPRLELEGQPVTLSHHKALALLAYLAVTGQRHTRLALAALFWPDYSPDDARSAVRRMLWVLNKHLGPEWLEVDRQTVLLPDQPQLWLDVKHFRELLLASHQHGHPSSEVCPACLEPLAAAVELAQGDFLAGFSLADSPDFDTWQMLESENLRRELAGALARLVQLLTQLGEPASEEAFTYARRWLALDPLHEPAHRQLMQLYAWAGQPAAAIQQYQACARTLAQELGLSPSPETTALLEAIKANRLPAPVSSITSPAHVTSPPPTPAAPPPPGGPPHNLPVQATPFIGRESALDGLQQRLADPEVRLMTIIGPGGIGKTRLALALAERQRQPQTIFADGVYFVSLAPIASAEVLPQTIAEDLTFPLSSAEEPATQLLTYLRHKRMLLVLDNFEHLMAGVSLVSQILQTAPGVKLLVTSRERLNLANEMLWPISGLNFAELTTVEEALNDEAVRLFVQTARRVRPDFRLRTEELAHLQRILQGVWGMPLAIELAAAWLNMLSLAEIAGELKAGLDFLESELRDTPDRHRSMRLVFDRSWERLDRAGQQLFAALAIFRGGFTREAAQQVAGASLRLLAGLVNQSLVVSQPDTGRYELHELLRQYAQEKLAAEPDRHTEIREAHAVYYADFMQRSWPNLRNFQQKETVAVIEQDIENIRVAWRYRLAQQNSTELLKFIDSFWLVHEIRGWYQAAIALFEEVAGQLPPDSGDEVTRLVRGKALGCAGYYSGVVGNPTRGLALAREGITLIRPLDQPEALMYALFYATLNHLYLGNLEQVIEVAQEFGQIDQQIGDGWFAGQAFSYQTTALVSQNKLGEAQQISERALQFAQVTADNFCLIWAALVRGRVAQVLGAYTEAQHLYERSLSAAQALNYRRTTQQSYDNLGDVALRLGELDQAERYFRLSLEISEETGQVRELLGTLYDLARVWTAQGKTVEAVELLAVVLHHPFSNLSLFLRVEDTVLMEAAERLRAELAAELGPAGYQAAWQRGETQPLETVVARLLR